MPSKAPLIEAILHHNPSARPEWLGRFDEPALRRYLDHLQHATEPRGAASAWVRDHGARPVVTRKPAA